MKYTFCFVKVGLGLGGRWVIWSLGTFLNNMSEIRDTWNHTCASFCVSSTNSLVYIIRHLLVGNHAIF